MRKSNLAFFLYQYMLAERTIPVICTIWALIIDCSRDDICPGDWSSGGNRGGTRSGAKLNIVFGKGAAVQPTPCCHVSSDSSSTPDIVVFVQVAADASHEHVPYSVSLTVPMVHDIAKARSVKQSVRLVHSVAAKLTNLVVSPGCRPNIEVSAPRARRRRIG